MVGTHGQVIGPPWNDDKQNHQRQSRPAQHSQEALRTRFDSLVARHYDKGLGELEKYLDEIGVTRP